MASTGGVPFVSPAPHGLPADALKPGQSIRGTVVEEGGALFIRAAGTRIALDASAALHAGQAVLLEMAQSADGSPRILITPLMDDALPNAQASNISADLAGALNALGLLARASDAAALFPGHITFSVDGIRALLALFAMPDASGDYATLREALASLLASGSLGPEATMDAERLVATLVLPSSATPRDMLALALQRAGASPESLLARALNASGVDTLIQSAADSAESRLARLIADPALRQFLGESGRLESFLDAASRITERLGAARLQNLQSPSNTYHFIEMPFEPGAPFQHARLHIFDDTPPHGRSRKQPRNASIVLDLATTRLGDLWVSLSLSPSHSDCAFRAMRLDAAEAIRAETKSLADALAAVGCPSPRIAVITWDGDRLRATAALMRRFSGIRETA